MSIRANISSSYRWRIGIVGIAALAFAAYCYYDGAVAYPAQKQRWEAYQQLIEQHPETYQKQWVALAESKGWKTEFPTERTDTDILTQYIMGGGCTLVGAFFFGSFLMMSRRFVETDDHALWDRKSKATWDQITDIDKSRWQNKGIAVVHFKEGGQDKRIVLDDWKFDRNATQRIMAHVEAKTGSAEAQSESADESAGESDEPAAAEESENTDSSEARAL
ncbi:MAG: hypothetical protein GVY24_05925 [Planctomycetes bacterium]|jgi:hypothetical protein|nr:hypothetical protein [Planctomycetota bacterium]